ncbi:MAG: ATP-grasp domain-containing protein [Thiobacillus sp.]
MLETANAICPQTDCLGLVYGSGFESQPDLIRNLSKERPLLGNAPEVLEIVSDPARFSDLLASLNIPHPVTQISRPPDTTGWLSKQAGACGGAHVRSIPSSPEDDEGRYFQRQATGKEWSFLFLANGQAICPVGFNQALTTPQQASGNWCYAGATRMDTGPDGIAGEVERAAQALTKKLGLVGLNGMDFIVTRSEWVLLELNPRPPATLELWDVYPLPALFNLHLQACNGQLPAQLPQPSGSMAVAVVYADLPSYTHVDFIWPSWCADLPWGGSVIEAGDPLCTVRAEGLDASSARQRVLDRRQDIQNQLTRFHTRLKGGTTRAYPQPNLMYQS